jgi:hypothetical protein
MKNDLIIFIAKLTGPVFEYLPKFDEKKTGTF